MTKIVSLQELAEQIPDRCMLGLGGSFLHRSPNALARQLVRREAAGLELVKSSPGYDLDLLVRGSVLRRVRVGIAAMDADLGLLPSYRAAVEDGELELEEHSCITLVSGLRAASFGVPFLPVAGLQGSDLPRINGWHQVADPYGSGESPWIVPAITPDVAVIHVNEVDELGNGRLYGSPHWDRVMTRAARRVLLTAERLVSTEEIARMPELTLVPGFLAEACAVVPGGAWPASMHPDYGADLMAAREYLESGPESFERHLAAAPEATGRIREGV